MDVNIQPYKTRDRDAIQPSIDFCEWMIDKEHQDLVAKWHFPARESSLSKLDDPKVHWTAEHYLKWGRITDAGIGGQWPAIATEQGQVYQKIFTGTPVAQAVGEYCEVVNALEFFEWDAL